MGIKVIITGATGMVGKGVLLECLASDKVDKILLLSRSSIGIENDKITEIIHKDFYNFSTYYDAFKGYDACYFCLGTSSFRMKEREYNEITYKMTLHLAKLLSEVNPEMSFCYVSGVGTDTTEMGRSMWARVKGKTENAILKLPFKSAFMFRPGFIQPVNGVKSKTSLYKTIYSIVGPFYPLLKWMNPNGLITTNDLAKAMIKTTLDGYDEAIIYNKDIVILSNE